MTPRKKLLFFSYHSLVDPASGAAVSVGDLLDALGRYRGWEIRSLTGPLLASEATKNPLFTQSFPVFPKKLLDFLQEL